MYNLFRYFLLFYYLCTPQKEYNLNNMNQKRLWMLAAILYCGMNVFTSCTSDNDDNSDVLASSGVRS